MERSSSRRLSRVGLLVWLLLPLVIVALLWMSIDRSQGRADPERWRRVPAGPGVGGSAGPAPGGVGGDLGESAGSPGDTDR